MRRETLTFKIDIYLEEKMKVTVEDISNFPEFADLKLIAGRGGLNNAASSIMNSSRESEKNGTILISETRI